MSQSPWGAAGDAGTRSQSFSGTSNVIGVDLGGTKVAVAALRGINLGDALVKPTDHSGGDALIDQLAEMIETAGRAESTPSASAFPPWSSSRPDASSPR